MTTHVLAPYLASTEVAAVRGTPIAQQLVRQAAGPRRGRSRITWSTQRTPIQRSRARNAESACHPRVPK
jgi:hypothetical protein